MAAAPGLVHYLLNKPRGVVTTASDPQGRPTVVTLVPAEPRVFPVGRLDRDTEGLLILTNDGELSQLLTHPSHGVAKEYLAEVEGTPSPGALRTLREGVAARRRDDGAGHGGRGVARGAAHRHPRGPQPPGPPDVQGGGPPGAPAGPHPIGPLSDHTLAPGRWRPLTSAEVRSLYAAAVGPG